MGVNSCSQQANVNMSHIGNFFSYPFNKLSDYINDNTDEDINEAYEKYTRSNSQTSPAACGRSPATINNPLADLENQMQGSLCQCRPWDTPIDCTPGNDCCHISLCPREIQCPLLCPEDINILKNNKEKASPVESEGNYFSFLNSGFDIFPNEVRPLEISDLENSTPSPAYNLGMISARRKFNELATFGLSNVPLFPGGDEDKKEYYQNSLLFSPFQ